MAPVPTRPQTPVLELERLTHTHPFPALRSRPGGTGGVWRCAARESVRKWEPVIIGNRKCKEQNHPVAKAKRDALGTAPPAQRRLSVSTWLHRRRVARTEAALRHYDYQHTDV